MPRQVNRLPLCEMKLNVLASRATYTMETFICEVIMKTEACRSKDKNKSELDLKEIFRTLAKDNKQNAQKMDLSVCVNVNGMLLL
eukprot:scaffold17647_cov83-Skeletonema_dohrnii-CCMP3373.AAC.2